MAPLTIEGCNLGQKHRNYNKLVDNVINSKLYQRVADINYEDSDLDNLFKIDMACHNRNVEYILKILKCEDMLYVSRAIKRSTWLVTDPQYVYIVNPTYLFNELFPHMTSKAINKFILHIRLSLKDEKRVEEFFNYYKQEDLHTALKWLPHCSITFTENIIKEYANKIPEKLISRLCERSISFLELFFKYKNYKPDTFLSTKYLIRKIADKYLDIIEDYVYNKASIAYYFTPKLTKIIMSKCYDRIIQNFELYADYFHIPTVVKYIRKEDSKDFLLKHKNNEALKPLFEIDEAQLLINRLPLQNRFELVKEIFIDEKYKEESIDVSSNHFLFSWYAYAPFHTAFDQLIRVIQKKSKANVRLSMFKVLLSSAKYNMQDICTLLKYYRENQIDEPFECKVQFVNLLLSTTKTHTFDEVTWGYLNDLFISIDMYSESGNQDVQTCIKSIILYNVIHNEVVPEIIEKKFIFDTCKEYQKKITQEENEKVFSYLFKYITTKLEQDIINQEKFTETGDVLEQILHLLLDWKRELQDFPNIIQKIKEIINLRRVKSWNYDITKLYNIKKSWKKIFFAESIVLNTNQEAFINALKHGPEVLETYKTEVEIICLSDNIQLQFLKKLRIYWPDSLANYYKTLFLNNLNQISYHKSLIIGLCTLLSQNEFLNLLNKYVPKQEKIDWTEHDEIELSLRKHIATRLHLARPQPSLAIALSYAKGDYVQYVLPSLNAILYNMSCSYTSENIKQIVDAPVSLQKHGIRISSRKLNKKQLMQLYSDIWKVNKNSGIRAILFCKTFDILLEEKDQETINVIWKSLSMFIDSLNSKEHQNIYKKLMAVGDVPACVRGEFWVKTKQILKSYQSNSNLKNFDYLRSGCWVATPEDILEENIITEIFFESLDNRLSTGNYDDPYTLAQYILSSKSEEVQAVRHRKVLVPILERCFALWDTKHENKYFVRTFFHKLWKRFCDYGTHYSDKEMSFRLTVLKDIFNRIECNLPMPENYILLLRFKLYRSFSNILSTKKEQIKEIKETRGDPYDAWQRLNEAGAQEIGRECVKHLRKDVKNIFPTVYNIYARVLFFSCNHCYFDVANVSLLLKTILEAKDLVEGHILVLETMKIKRERYDELQEFASYENELLDEIQKHPSDEVKCHYWQYWYDNIGKNYNY